MFQFETIGNDFVQSTGASVDVKVAVARGAMEVVVVLRGDTGEFVPVAVSWY